MRFLSICSGIEAASAAWIPLGMTCAAVAEIEAFCCDLLKSQYPTVTNLGDISADDFIDRAKAAGPIDILVGGPPCQAFSIAGLRGGLADARGNLTLRYLAVVDALRPRWVVYENVPGILSSTSHDAPDPCPPQSDMDACSGYADGAEVVVEDKYDADENHAFSCLLAGLSELGYGWAYGSLDAQYFELAQRRERVFVVGHLGAWQPAAAVLFDRESMSWNPPPSREAREATAEGTASGINGCCVSECDGTLYARGMCHKHYHLAYQKAARHGLKLPPLPVINSGDCSIPGCGRKAEKRTWCGTHYARWKKDGYVHAEKPITFALPVEDRFWAKVNKEGPIPEFRPELGRCWLWTAALNEHGYGIFDDGGVTTKAHRYAFTECVGQITEKLDLDHLCRVRHCVCPNHLEPVTNEENIRRGVIARNDVGFRLSPAPTSSGRGVSRTGESRGQDCVIPILEPGSRTGKSTDDIRAGSGIGDDGDPMYTLQGSRQHGVFASTGEISHCLNAGGMGRIDYETETLVTHSLRADGFDASEDGTGRGTPIIPVAFSCKDHGADAGEMAPTLRAMGHDGRHANTGGQVAVAFNLRGRDGGAQPEMCDAASLRASSGGSSRSYIAGPAVRRLSVIECARLQGFPDLHTFIDRKPRKIDQEDAEYYASHGIHAWQDATGQWWSRVPADGPQYKAYGNSMAVPCMRWIGKRIKAVTEALV